MPTIAAARTGNATFLADTEIAPVAIFVGGTSGIGQAEAALFAKYTNGNAQIIIVGRNRASAEATIADFPPQPAGVAPHAFIEAELTLLHNVDALTQRLLKELPKLNYLFITSGLLPMPSYELTAEGLDPVMVISYYARWKLVHDLIPLISKTKDTTNERVGVELVYAAGNGGEVNSDDFGLEKTKGFINYANQIPTYIDMSFETFANQYPKVPFVHIFPGLTRTPLLARTPHWAFVLVWPLLYTFISLFIRSAEESADVMLHTVLKRPTGFTRAGPAGNYLGKVYGKNGWFVTDELQQKLYTFTLHKIRTILSST